MVDALNGSSQLANYSEAKKQVSVADRLIFSKLDITDTAVVEELRQKVIGLNPTAQLIDALNGVVNVQSLLNADIYDIRTKGIEVQSWLKEEEKNASHVSHKHDINRHDEHIETFTVTYNKPLDWTAFGIWLTMLLHAHGERVLRVKGILNVTGVDAPVIINGVQHVVHPPLHLKSWPSKDRRSHIIFIVDDMKKEDIERSLSVFNGLGGRSR
jgi:G3E family GTPase